MERMNRYLEVFWLGLTIIAALMALYLLVNDGYVKSKYMTMIPLIPAAVWIMRRALRLRLEKSQKEAKKKGKKEE